LESLGEKRSLKKSEFICIPDNPVLKQEYDLLEKECKDLERQIDVLDRRFPIDLYQDTIPIVEKPSQISLLLYGKEDYDIRN
jgi:hypothetical protein